MWRILTIICTLAPLAGIILVSRHPVNSTLLNLILLGCIFGAWLGLLMLMWKRKPLRIAVLALPLFAAIPFMLPGRAIDANELRSDYLQRMAAFEGTKYHWGGENRRGIDCSGLPRRALRDALFSYGVRNLNGRASRAFIEQWWFDASAKALSEGHRDYTIPLGVTGTIQKMDYQNLIPGDLAVTTDGVHILAYAGDERWIQADPGIGAVATLNGRTADNSWFKKTVTTHRWQIFGQHHGNE